MEDLEKEKRECSPLPPSISFHPLSVNFKIIWPVCSGVVIIFCVDSGVINHISERKVDNFGIKSGNLIFIVEYIITNLTPNQEINNG